MEGVQRVCREMAYGEAVNEFGGGKGLYESVGFFLSGFLVTFLVDGTNL